MLRPNDGMRSRLRMTVPGSRGGSTRKPVRSREVMMRNPETVLAAGLTSKESLVTAAADEVRSMILRGELPPGLHIVENAIALRFGVSQGTIRAALHILVHEGLLEIKPRRGCFVKRFSSRDATEIYTLRNALESLAARGAAENMSKAE